MKNVYSNNDMTKFESANKSRNIDMGYSNNKSARIQQVILEVVCHRTTVPAAKSVAMQKHAQLKCGGYITKFFTCNTTYFSK